MELSKEQKIFLVTKALEEEGFTVKDIQDNSYQHASHDNFSDSGSHFHVEILKKFETREERREAQRIIMKKMMIFIPEKLHSITLEFVQK